jgi:hypothetical protein
MAKKKIHDNTFNFEISSLKKRSICKNYIAQFARSGIFCKKIFPLFSVLIIVNTIFAPKINGLRHPNQLLTIAGELSY